MLADDTECASPAPRGPRRTRNAARHDSMFDDELSHLTYADVARLRAPRVRRLVGEDRRPVQPRVPPRASSRVSSMPVRMPDGSTHWYRGRHLHRSGGLPAIERPDGSKAWYSHGIYQYAESAPRGGAEPAPAPRIESVREELEDGTQRWTISGVLHRDDGPAWIHWSGACKWYRNGLLHRDDGPAWIAPRMFVKYYRHGRLHRDDGPAVIHVNGTMMWQRSGNPGVSVRNPAPLGYPSEDAVPMNTVEQAEASARAITGGVQAATRAIEELPRPREATPCTPPEVSGAEE